MDLVIDQTILKGRCDEYLQKVIHQTNGTVLYLYITQWHFLSLRSLQAIIESLTQQRSCQGDK